MYKKFKVYIFLVHKQTKNHQIHKPIRQDIWKIQKYAKNIKTKIQPAIKLYKITSLVHFQNIKIRRALAVGQKWA